MWWWYFFLFLADVVTIIYCGQSNELPCTQTTIKKVRQNLENKQFNQDRFLIGYVFFPLLYHFDLISYILKNINRSWVGLYIKKKNKMKLDEYSWILPCTLSKFYINFVYMRVLRYLHTSSKALDTMKDLYIYTVQYIVKDVLVIFYTLIDDE